MLSGDFWSNLEIVLGIVCIIWIYGWFKKQLNSSTLALILTIIVGYLTIFQYPELVYIPFIYLIVVNFFSGMFEKIPSTGRVPEHMKE